MINSSSSRSWRECIVDVNGTLRNVAENLSKTGREVVLIVGENESLTGLLTDSDIRRALLSGFSLNDDLIHALNRNPCVGTPTMGRADLLNVMKTFGVRHLPILDCGKITGLVTLRDLLTSEPSENPVVILAGGRGQRLSPLTDSLPKPLIPIQGTPVLELIIERVVSQGFTNLLLLVHYKKELIQEFFGDGKRLGANITYIEESTPLGTAGGLSLIESNPKLPVLVMNGDVLNHIPLAKLLEYHNSVPTDMTISVRKAEFSVPFGVMQIESDEVRGIREKPSLQLPVNAGVYVVSPSTIQRVRRDENLDMPALILQLINEGCRIRAFPVHEYWIDIGSHEDLARANNEWFLA